MHELSIAYSLVEIAESAARRAGARRVVEVQVVVGAFAGVAVDALRFSYDVATAGTLLEGSRLAVRSVPLAVHCAGCAEDVDVPELAALACPRCGAPTADIRRGRELYVEGLEIEDPPDAPAAPDGTAAVALLESGP